MQEINGFKIEKYNQHNLPENNKTSTCPLCSHERKNKKQKCLSIDWIRGLARCNHCGELIQLHTYKKNNSKTPIIEWENNTNLSDEVVKWFESRKIGQFTLRSLKVSEKIEWMPIAKAKVKAICFNYFINDELTNIKYRAYNKDFKLHKNAKLSLYNQDNIRLSKECIIVEGELDVLSFVETGIYHCVSVPNGANLKNNNFSYIDLKYFNNKDRIYLAVDNDEPGVCLRDDLIDLFDKEKIYLVSFNDCKDANEYLMKYGIEALGKTIDSATPLTTKRQIVNEFPIDIFPSNIQNYMNECSRVFNDNRDFMGAGFLWMLSVILGNSIHVQAKFGWSDPAILWIAIIGFAGKGKTPSLDRVLFPLSKINDENIQQFNKDFKDYAEFQALTKKEKQEVLNQSGEILEPTTKQFIIEDTTYEAIAPIHEKNPISLGLYDDELSGWIKSMTRYNATSSLPLWLKSWTGGSLKINRKTATSHFVKKPFIPILGGIQPGIFESFYDKENKDSGHLDRMLLVYPEVNAEYFNDNELDPFVEDGYIEFIQGMYSKVRDELIVLDEFDNIIPHVSKLTPEAKIEFKRVYNWLTDLINSDDENEYLKSMYPKLQRYIGRFALLIDFVHKYAFGGELMLISKESILRAEKLVVYFITMGNKVKFQSKEMNSVQSMINDKSKNPFEILKMIYEKDKDFNRTNIANQLEINRRTIIRWVKKIDDGVTL